MEAVSVNSFARSNYKSVRAASAKGLINEPGSNNCFLNSAVQVLWHLDVFRRSFRLLSAHRCTRDSCIFCALKVVFTQFEYSDHAQIAPDQLRKALAACTSYLPSDDDQLSVASGQSSSAGSASVAQFALGSMADACECLENLLLRLHAHLDYSPRPPTAASPCVAAHCLTHAKFAMHVRESLACNSCGARTALADYVQLVYYVATHAILANVRTTSESYGVPDAFGRALRAAASVGELRQCSACNQRGASIARQLACSPDVLGVGLVWNSASPSSGTLTTLYEAIGTSLRVHDLFDSPATSGSSSPAGTQPHQLVGVVCYVGRHYATFMYHSRTCTWILFDDSNVKEIGRSWHLVVARCLKCRFVPVLLLYANPAASTIDAACVPQSTVQISNAELLRTIELANACPPAGSSTTAGGNGSLSRGAATRHERSSSLTGSSGPNGGSSLERNSRLHKKARPAVFQSRVRAVASVDNLQNAARSRDDAPNDEDDDAQFGFGQLAARATLGRTTQQSTLRDSAVHRRQNSLVHALGIADDQCLPQHSPQPSGQLTAQVLRTRAFTAGPPRRYDEQQQAQQMPTSLSANGGTLKRVKSLENVVGGLSLFDGSASGNGTDSVDLDAPFQPSVNPAGPSVLYGLRTPVRTLRPGNAVTDESGDSSIESSAASYATRGQLALARQAQATWTTKSGAADGELNPRAIEALGFRQQFADLLAKADALVREASEYERVSNFTEALLRFTQAAICLKQASDLPAIEQSNRLAAVSRQNACNASVKRLHRTLNELAGAAAADMPLGPGATALSAAAADRQDSGVSTWSEADPSGHSTASEELFTAPQRSVNRTPAHSQPSRLNDSIQIISITSSPDKMAGVPHSLSYQNGFRQGPNGNFTDGEPEHAPNANGEDAQLAYANTLTQLGPYATLPRKPKTRTPNESQTGADEPLYAPQSAFTAQNVTQRAPPPYPQSAAQSYGTLPAPVPAPNAQGQAPVQGQPVVFSVRSTRRATRNEEIYATYTQMNQFGASEPQAQVQTQNHLNSAFEQPRLAAAPPPPKPNAALIRQRMEQLQQVRQNVAPTQAPAAGSNWMPQPATFNPATAQVQHYASRPANPPYQDQANSSNSVTANNGGNVYQLSANIVANVRSAESIYARRSELTDASQQAQPQSQAIVARSANANKFNQPFKTPQPVRRTFVLDAAQVQPTPTMAHQSAASSFTHATPASFTDGTMQPPPAPPMPPSSQYITRAQLLTSAGNAQLQIQPQRNAAQPLPAPASPNQTAEAQAKLSKKKVTFLDDLIAKQAERVRQNMAQMGNNGRRADSSPSPAPAPTPAPFATGNAQVHLNVANCSLRRTVLNANASGDELFSDSSLSSLNSNSTRQSIPIGNRFAYNNNLPVPAYTSSGHDADNETSSSIASSVDLPMSHSQVNTLVCKLCQQRSTAYPDSYCSVCAVYMSKLIPS